MVERLKRVMTYSELKVCRELAEILGQDNEEMINISKVSDKLQITKSTTNYTLRLLEVAGAIETRSCGPKGTYIKTLDINILKDAVK